MRRKLQVALVALMLAPSAGMAQDFDAGVLAWQSGDYATALREWTPLATQGDARAQAILGVMYDNGRGVPQDDAEAVKWYRLAAEQSDAWAQNNLGVMYEYGQGLPQNFVASRMWYNLAASAGNEKAVANRDRIAGKMLPADISEAQRRAGPCLASNYSDCD